MIIPPPPPETNYGGILVSPSPSVCLSPVCGFNFVHACSIKWCILYTHYSTSEYVYLNFSY